jgi:hypothetical protein
MKCSGWNRLFCRPFSLRQTVERSPAVCHLQSPTVQVDPISNSERARVFGLVTHHQTDGVVFETVTTMLICRDSSRRAPVGAPASGDGCRVHEPVAAG